MVNFPVLQTCFVPFKVQELVLKVWLKEKVRKKKKKDLCYSKDTYCVNAFLCHLLAMQE